MTLHVPTLEPHELRQCDEDVRQLTKPWQRRVMVRRLVGYDRSRNAVYEDQAIWQTEPPLLDLLRRAAVGVLPQRVFGTPGRRKVQGSPPPPGWNQEASERLRELYAQVNDWVARLGVSLGRPVGREEDYFAIMIRRLAWRAEKLDADTARELVSDIHRWWVWCVTHAGFSAEELLGERRGQ